MFTHFFLFAVIHHHLLDQTLLKEEITLCKRQLEETQEPSPLYYRLAQAALADQEQERAFLYFLQALDTAKSAPHRVDLTQYEKVLPLYLKGEKPTELIKLEGKDPALNFLVSTAYANEGNYQKFFELFYASYSAFKGSFLDFKARGILYLRLAQRGGEKRECYLAHAKQNLEQALLCNRDDGSLYPILIALAKDAKKGEDVLSYLKKLSESEAMIARSEILPYVEEAVALGAYDLAKAIVEKGRTLYRYSRSILAAERLIGSE